MLGDLFHARKREETMTRGKGHKVTEGRSLTIGEREDLKGQRQEAEATLKYLAENPGASRGDVVDKSILKREIDKYDAILAENSPNVPRGTNKDRMVARARELEGIMQKNLPSREQMDHPARNPGAIRKHMLWDKANAANIQEYKEIQRRLEPEDPTATDIEKLRREK